MTGREGAAERMLGDTTTDTELHALRASWALGREQRRRTDRSGDPLAAVTVEQRTASGYLVRLAGVFDAFNAPELGERLVGLVDAGAKRLLIDLRDTTLMDSSGLGALLAASLRLREHDGDLTLLAGPQPVMQGFRLTGLDTIFGIYVDEVDALAALKAR
jgi:anti-sigma B factor antagonist